MKNLQAILAALMLTFFGATSAQSEFVVGVSGSFAMLGADGSETEGGEKTNKSIEHNFGMGSVFAEFQGIGGTGLGFGMDYIPFAADVASKTKKRSDTETSVTDTAAEVETARTQKAQAEIENHMTLYATYSLDNGFYLKAGIIEADLNTLESLGTGSKYNNTTLDGVVYGLGFQRDAGSNSFMRAEYTYSDYDEISLTSTVARANVSTNNKVKADLDASLFTLSYGFKF
ncbi:MAG: hypothetical protein CBE23_000475 [Candidatus Pelagibacter sp. TMED263]|nr:MAG: hypothetical protein CBE23_000475 [Candidatus Pelagibacter sp. TMED263]|tara:strand:- start:46 stop:735 length:690 start_codon:yes stop_codon:yes gene_type:complete